LTSTTYYAQANGQVEAANKGIITLIKKEVKENPKIWHKILNQALWAYRNSPRESTKTTPFRVTFGHTLYCQQKSVFNQPEFKDNVKFLSIITGK